MIAVDRRRDTADRLESLLADMNVRVEWVPSIDVVTERFEEAAYDVLLITSSAFRAGTTDGIELLEVIGVRSPATQIIFLMASDDIRTAMRAVRASSCQYVKEPASDEELRSVLQMAIEAVPASPPERGAGRASKPRRFEKLVGESQPMQGVYRQIRQAGATDVPVLLLGETGTGKDLVAQAIHNQSARSDGPFMAVNLGAMPMELVASELFGYERGAFTGAREAHPGRFEQTHGGTILLDEIGTADEKVQVSLLRLIEKKRFHRLGARRERKTDVRVIAASNEDLEESVRRGRFREDLFFRLDVFRITLPALRDRAPDIPLLVDEFLRRYNEQFDKRVIGVAPECLALLERYEWPGNVRELKNVVQRAVLVCEGETVLAEHLPPRFRPARRARIKVAFEVGTPLAEVEREMIVRTLEETGNNKKRAAELLGISRRALYNKLRKHQIG
ncbi:sigma-54-dependent Fis family transcriptional regulator [bacterium]|nr:sigma-54-dependent Fis family transcriptional regulator [bacterium]